MEGELMMGQGALGGQVATRPARGLEAALDRRAHANAKIPRGDAENFVSQGQTVAGSIGSGMYGSADPGYPTPATSTPPAYEETDLPARGGFMGCMHEIANQPRQEKPESPVAVKDQLRNIDRALELIVDASSSDSVQQWATIDTAYRELRGEINRIKHYLGI